MKTIPHWESWGLIGGHFNSTHLARSVLYIMYFVIIHIPLFWNNTLIQRSEIHTYRSYFWKMHEDNNYWKTFIKSVLKGTLIKINNIYVWYTDRSKATFPLNILSDPTLQLQLYCLSITSTYAGTIPKLRYFYAIDRINLNNWFV